MRRLIFLILFVLFTIATIAWLTGLESPFSGARTHSVLTHDDKSSRAKNSGTKNDASKPMAASLLLGANVDYSKQSSGKTQAAASSAVPSLVFIEVKKDGEWRNEPAGKKLLGKLAAYGVNARAGGSGFFIDKQGTILTNFSILLGGYTWKVHSADGQDTDAELVGVDPATDLALIRISKAGTLPIRWSGSQPNFAEALLLLGFDAKNGPRVMDVMTSSGIQESANSDEAVSLKHFLVDYDSLDHCPGWLLSNLEGSVVGVVAHVENPVNEQKRDTVVISTESVQPIIDALQNTPLLHRVYIGLDSRQLTSALANLIGVKPDKGLLVAQVNSDSPLAMAGLQSGDVIIGLGDIAINSNMQFYQQLAGMAIGAKVPLQIQRGDQRLTLHVVLQEHKSGLQQLVQQWLDLVAKKRKETADEAAR
ncbi:MAG: S1C family serine protease [Verrucomicrobiales bacterium]|jgi:S1-C subfamily serine protease|nr:S1C family serine protease [Verrucomicrobiales bacterium]